MRILFDSAVYDLRNKGNVALLQVALSRVSRMWPSASLEVITSAPHLLKLYWPSARPISPDGRHDFYQDRNLFRSFARSLPRPALSLLFELREAVWRSQAAFPQTLIENRHRSRSGKAGDVQGLKAETYLEKSPVVDYLETVKPVHGVDLLVATGAQYMSDACKDDALRVLDRLEAAKQFGKPTVMVGQGLGPIRDPELQTRAGAILPLVDLIFIREARTAPQLLASLGVDPTKVIFTGDDAIEMAYEARTTACGTAIGVSMRVAHYTSVGRSHLEILQAVLQRAATKRDVRLIAVPISHSAHELDDKVVRLLMAQGRNTSISWRRFETPLEVIRKVGRCRLVVTGTFHAAVFALAQGIPAVGLAKSAMYVDKFLGLADQFGPGCQVVYLDDNHLERRLTDAIDTAWESAQQVRPHLLEAAVRQIDLGRGAYQRLYALVEPRMRRDEVLRIGEIGG